MKLRRLENKDAILMLEWMHDDYVVSHMQTNFKEKTIEDCLGFIKNSFNTKNRHLAIVDDSDTYMGTVSLKNITEKTAEFAITIRACAMGKDYARWGMHEMINRGFNEIELKEIYWCVSPNNVRALKFYDKNEYKRVDSKEISMICDYTSSQIKKYIWYLIKKENYIL